MPLTDDLAAITRQEREILLPSFDYETAWRIGLTLRELAIARKHSIVIDVRRFGTPHQQLFYAALPGTTPENGRWIQRKANVVARFHRSSYSLGLYLQQNNSDIVTRYALPAEDYATHGGSFPITLANAGIVGAVTVSGLAQREDHNLAVEALCLEAGLDYNHLRLATVQ